MTCDDAAVSVSEPNKKPPGQVAKPEESTRQVTKPEESTRQVTKQFDGRRMFGLTLTGILLVVVGVAAVWLLDKSPDARANDLRAFAYIVPVLLVAFPGAYIAVKRQQVLEAQHNLERARENTRVDELDKANQRADAKDFRERYVSASTQLGDDKPMMTRLAGVYAMSNLADDWGMTDPAQRQACIDVLCAYLRAPLRRQITSKTSGKPSCNPSQPTYIVTAKPVKPPGAQTL